MTRSEYLATLLRCYVESPDTPDQPSRRDWAIAADLYRRGVDLAEILHAIRLATLRRHLKGPHPSIHSMAYYRAVLNGLTPDELEPDYVCYVHRRHRLLDIDELKPKPRPESQDPALFERR